MQETKTQWVTEWFKSSGKNVDRFIHRLNYMHIFADIKLWEG